MKYTITVDISSWTTRRIGLFLIRSNRVRTMTLESFTRMPLVSILEMALGLCPIKKGQREG